VSPADRLDMARRVMDRALARLRSVMRYGTGGFLAGAPYVTVGSWADTLYVNAGRRLYVAERKAGIRA
jgi:hypothetical protein